MSAERVPELAANFPALQQQSGDAVNPCSFAFDSGWVASTDAVGVGRQQNGKGGDSSFLEQQLCEVDSVGLGSAVDLQRQYADGTPEATNPIRMANRNPTLAMPSFFRNFNISSA